VFAPSFSPEQVNAFVDALKLFKIGYSWGGVTSLALAYPLLDRPGKQYAGRIVRLNIGLEEKEDLVGDLAAAFATLNTR
jgi:cystathionine beta-lyase